MKCLFVRLFGSLTAWACLIAVGIVVIVGAPKPASAVGPVFLTEGDRAAIIGGCATGDANCICSSSVCGGLSDCATQSATCVDNGAGSCIKLVTGNQMFCGAPDTDKPKGCQQFTSGTDVCADVAYFMKPQTGCMDPSCGKLNHVAPCGDNQISCQNN